MRQILRISVLLTTLFLSIHTTESYVRIQLRADIPPLAWNLVNPNTPIVSNGRVTYNIDTAGSDNLPFSEVERAIDRSFQSWENVPTSIIAFQRGPNITSDKTNLPGAFDIFWKEDSTIITIGDNAVDISGALAVTFTGSINGEIVDLFVVANGNQFTWATNGRADAIDVQQVMTHEIGHAIGIDHSPNAASTMFPRTGEGRINARTLSMDDEIAASVIYPSPAFSSTTGSITGRVVDNNGAPIFGAHIGVVDANGIAITGALSQADGTYSIQGLPSGDYTIYAEPLDPIDNPFFNRLALSDYYQNINIDFQTTPDFQVGVSAGATTPFDIQVIRVTPALDTFLVLEPDGVFLLPVGATLSQGQNDVSVGVAGPGLPQSGTPLTITGPGITITQTLFGTTNTGLPVVAAIVNVSPTAPIGPRNIIVDNGVQRTIVSGGVEILPAPSVTSIVSQTHYAPLIAVESLATAFGSDLAFDTAIASPNPLPTSLLRTTILIRDSAGNEGLAPLLYVSPTQLNFRIPPGIRPGTASITFTNGTGGSVTTTIEIHPVAPGIFTIDATGSGPPVGFVLRKRANGTDSYEPIAGFNPELGEWVPIPINMGPETDRVLLVLFGTGFRHRSQLPTVTIGGVNCGVIYAGREGGQLPLRDQVNIDLPRSLIGLGTANVEMIVDGRQANTVSVNIQ
jgi:uncharacterized protein (TIGR03437 family)